MARDETLDHGPASFVGEVVTGGRDMSGSAIRRRLRFDELGILVAAVMFFAIGGVSNRYFLTLDNLTGILQSITFLGFLSIGVRLAPIAGEIDISVGSVYEIGRAHV